MLKIRLGYFTGWLLIVLLLSGCSAEPMPGSSIAESVKSCLESGNTPRYIHTGATTEFTCH